MVTILRPRHRKPDKTLSDDQNPGTVGPHDDTDAERGIELDDDDADEGTASAPGEGPNPTA